MYFACLHGVKDLETYLYDCSVDVNKKFHDPHFGYDLSNMIILIFFTYLMPKHLINWFPSTLEIKITT